jgi:uncharacterized membrane protein
LRACSVSASRSSPVAWAATDKVSALRATTVKRARRGVLAAMSVLGLLVVVATLRSSPWPANLFLVIAWLVPVLLPLRGLLAGSRRAYAWATLCVSPYLIAGVTEMIANPALRTFASFITFASLAWFAALIWYLRVTRSETAPRPPVPQAPA